MKKGYLGIAAMLVICVGILMPITTALAQEIGVAAGGDQVEVARSITLGSLIKQGGPFMYPLGLFSVAMFYFIIRNLLLLREKNMLREDLKPQIEALMKERDVAKIRELCSEHDSLLLQYLMPAWSVFPRNMPMILPM